MLVLSLLILLLSEDDACAKVRRMPTAADSPPGQLVDMAAKEASASQHKNYNERALIMPCYQMPQSGALSDPLTELSRGEGSSGRARNEADLEVAAQGDRHSE